MLSRYLDGTEQIVSNKRLDYRELEDMYGRTEH